MDPLKTHLFKFKIKKGDSSYWTEMFGGFKCVTRDLVIKREKIKPEDIVIQTICFDFEKMNNPPQP